MIEEKEQAPEAPQHPEIANDPEVLAEAKKTRIWHLRLERYKDVAKAVGIILQTFRAEAISLMSGLGTLVVGWFQLKKWVIQGRHEAKATEQQPVVSKGRTTHRHNETAQGTGYGSGSGRLGSGQGGHTVMQPPPPQGGELIEVPSSSMADSIPAAFTDPMTYVPILTLVVFIWSSVVAWFKRKKKLSETEGGK